MDIKAKLYALPLRARQFIKYCLVGFSGTVIDIGILALLFEVFSVPLLAANALSFTAAASSNFYFNKLFTFRDTQKNIGTQYTKFFTVSVIGLVISSGVIAAGNELGLWYLISKVFSIGLVLIWNFGANALWTFRRHS